MYFDLIHKIRMALDSQYRASVQQQLMRGNAARFETAANGLRQKALARYQSGLELLGDVFYYEYHKWEHNNRHEGDWRVTRIDNDWYGRDARYAVAEELVACVYAVPELCNFAKKLNVGESVIADVSGRDGYQQVAVLDMHGKDRGYPCARYQVLVYRNMSKEAALSWYEANIV